ncbi:MAG TPA: hypothetical protein VGZ48_01690 [Candidatus Acidoferrales bacterium]|jgi:hypothetical protein|nr:hypothetical protein [Candidatus Acidoferrales bacterium]
MRILISLFLTAALALGTYYLFLKHGGAGGPGSLPTQAITTTGIQMDLTEIAEGERLYYAQAGGYGTMDQLVSTGAMAKARTGRDGYTYTIDLPGTGFLVTAKWTPSNSDKAKAGLNYPVYIVDQTFQVRQQTTDQKQDPQDVKQVPLPQ